MINKRESDILETINQFPCLKKIIGLHGMNLMGLLISKEDMETLFLSKRDCENSANYMKVLCVIPNNYKEIGCQVKDLDGFIDWKKLPNKHKHINKTKNGETYLCTHLIEESKDMENPILENLKTAYALSLEYKRYLKTGKFELKEYSHGDEGRKEYERRRKGFTTK